MKYRTPYLLTIFLLLNSCSYIEEKAEIVKYECNYIKDLCKDGIKYFLKALSLTDKDRLDLRVGEYWHNWKATGKDTTDCIVDFDKIITSEWDTLVYVNYNYSKNHNNLNAKEVANIIESPKIDFGKRNSFALEEFVKLYSPEEYKKCNINKLYFLNKGKKIDEIELFMASDDAKGVFFCTNKDFIKRGRSNAKFHLIKDYDFYVIRDTTESFVPMSYGF